MPTECIPNPFGFASVEGRQVVAAFDGGCTAGKQILRLVLAWLRVLLRLILRALFTRPAFPQKKHHRFLTAD
jgi:hypothetical protein